LINQTTNSKGVSDVYGDNGEHDNGDMMAVVLNVQQNKSNVLAA
jgi:hypothetical protein